MKKLRFQMNADVRKSAAQELKKASWAVGGIGAYTGITDSPLVLVFGGLCWAVLQILAHVILALDERKERP